MLVDRRRSTPGVQTVACARRRPDRPPRAEPTASPLCARLPPFHPTQRDFAVKIVREIRDSMMLLLAGSFACAYKYAHNLTVAAYLPEWRYEGANWHDISAVVNQLILFSLEVQPTGRLAAFDRLPRKELMAEARAATYARIRLQTHRLHRREWAQRRLHARRRKQGAQSKVCGEPDELGRQV